MGKSRFNSRTTAVIPRRNKKTKVMQNFGGQIRCTMGDVQVAYMAFQLVRNVVIVLIAVC